MFISVGENGVILSSPDGINWSKWEYVEKNGLDHYDVFIDDKFETIADLMAHHKNKEFKLPFMNYNSIKSEEEEEAIKQVLAINNNQMSFYKS
jgi:hypothetical protein